MTPRDVSLPPFTPAFGLSNGHVMTIAAWAKPRRYPGLPSPDIRFYPTDPDTTVRGDGYWQPDRARVPTLVALHGLEGSSEGHYMRGLALQAWRRGWNAVLLNHRNCGGTEHLTRGLYHSGLTADVGASLGAAVLLASRYIDRERLDGPEYLTLMLLSSAGMVAMASANDLITVFVALEIVSIPLYVLAAFDRRRSASLESGLKYFLLGAFASAVFLYGIALVYGATGHTDLAGIAQRVQQLPPYLFARINKMKYEKRVAGIDITIGRATFTVCGANPKREADPALHGPCAVAAPGRGSTIFQICVDDLERALATCARGGRWVPAELERAEEPIGVMAETIQAEPSEVAAIVKIARSRASA